MVPATASALGIHIIPIIFKRLERRNALARIWERWYASPLNVFQALCFVVKLQVNTSCGCAANALYWLKVECKFEQVGFAQASRVSESRASEARERLAQRQEVQLRGSVMVAKPFMMAVLATLLGPAMGLGLFILLH